MELNEEFFEHYPNGNFFKYLINKITAIDNKVESIQNEVINFNVPSVWLKRKEAIEYLGVSRETFYRLEQDGVLVASNIGGGSSPKLDRFRRKDLDEIIEKPPVYFRR